MRIWSCPCYVSRHVRIVSIRCTMLIRIRDSQAVSRLHMHGGLKNEVFSKAVAIQLLIVPWVYIVYVFCVS